jgi:hypothetical protein
MMKYSTFFNLQCNHIEACKAKALEIMELAPMLHPDAVTRLVRLQPILYLHLISIYISICISFYLILTLYFI